MEVLLRGPSAASSPDSLWLGTLSDSIGESTWRHRQSLTLWPSDGFAICAVSRQGHFIVGDWTSSSPRNGANRKRLAIFPFQPSAVALFPYPRPSTKWYCRKVGDNRRAKLYRRRLGGRRGNGRPCPASPCQRLPPRRRQYGECSNSVPNSATIPTKYAWSLDHTQKAKRHRRATAGMWFGVPHNPTCL